MPRTDDAFTADRDQNERGFGGPTRGGQLAGTRRASPFL